MFAEKNCLTSDDIVVVRLVTATYGEILKSGMSCYHRLQVSSVSYHSKVTGVILLHLVAAVGYD